MACTVAAPAGKSSLGAKYGWVSREPPKNRFRGFFLGEVRMSEYLDDDASAGGVIRRRLAGVERAERIGETATATTGDAISKTLDVMRSCGCGKVLENCGRGQLFEFQGLLGAICRCNDLLQA